MSNRSLVAKGATTSNGKLAKERLTILLRASATGKPMSELMLFHDRVYGHLKENAKKFLMFQLKNSVLW